MARNINIGKVALKFCGLWDNITAYNAFDCVNNNNNSSFVALKDVPIGTPLTDEEYWYRQTNFDDVVDAEAARELEFQTKIMQIDSDVESAEQAVIDVGEIGDAKITAINDAGSTQVTNVNNAGDTKVTEVNTAGANKLNEINAAGAVLYSAQTLNDTQKITSRGNIGAASEADVAENSASISELDTTKVSKNVSKNLFGGTWRIGGVDLNTGLDKNDITWTNSSEISITPNTIVALSINESINAASVYIFYYDSSLTSIVVGTSRYTQLTYGYFPKVFTIPNDSRIAYIKVNIEALLDTTKTQLEINSMPTSYRLAESKEISPVDLPNTVGGYYGKRIFFLGDSITALSNNTSWAQFLIAAVKPISYVNYAVGGSTWRDSSAGLTYDGNPATLGLNFVGNQVQRIVNNALLAPDCIFIAAGTNDIAWEIPTDADIETAFYDAEMTAILRAAIDRSTWYGSIRWTVDTLKAQYPNAVIFLCTPPHRKYVSGTANSTYASILAKNTIIKKMALRTGVEVIDFMECGGYNMSSRYFVDDLHPTPLLARMMATYAEKKFINTFNV